MDYETFIQRYGDHPHWTRRRSFGREYFETDLRKALDGNPDGFHEIAVYGAEHKDFVLIVRDLWNAGVSIRYPDIIKRHWCLESRRFVEALGTDLDAFLPQTGLTLGHLPEEFDVWRGSDMSETPVDLATARSWTTSYSVACAFALQNSLWKNARMEQAARDANVPEPIVVKRHVRRNQAVAWIGGLEREVILGQAALDTPIQVCGSLREWRRRKSRKRVSVT